MALLLAFGLCFALLWCVACLVAGLVVDSSLVVVGTYEVVRVWLTLAVDFVVFVDLPVLGLLLLIVGMTSVYWAWAELVGWPWPLEASAIPGPDNNINAPTMSATRVIAVFTVVSSLAALRGLVDRNVKFLSGRTDVIWPSGAPEGAEPFVYVPSTSYSRERRSGAVRPIA